MKLSAPKEITFIIAAILAVVGVMDSQGIIHIGHAFGFVIAGFIVLAFGNLLKGL